MRASRDPDAAVQRGHSGTTSKAPKTQSTAAIEEKVEIGCQEEELVGDPSWKSSDASVAELADKVQDVFDDQCKGGQVLKLAEHEARTECQVLVVAALGVIRKDKPNGVVTARVVFDGSNGSAVNR